jgi:flavin reductase (DIM6/NTAB) family NADH-FMN oxidoreductase RutF
MKRLVRPLRPVNPTTASLVTSVDPEGRPNIITLAETYNLSIATPVILGIGIAKPRYSHRLIEQCREFVVNLPTAAMAETVDRCGTVSGRVLDKFAAFGLTPVPATKVRPPLIAECPVNIECRLIEIIETGDHDLFLGEAVAQHVDEAALDADGRPIPEKLNLLAFAFGRYFSLGQVLGRHGFTKRAR